MDQHTEQNKCNDILPMLMELFCLRLRLNNLIPVMFPFHIPNHEEGEDKEQWLFM